VIVAARVVHEGNAHADVHDETSSQTVPDTIRTRLEAR